ncbi:peptidyl-prolyl cis-trans isomerase B (cyclophilin B) [Pseudonocardia thermophila]|jgi:Peptidyl-prolyl cis-trans isomerase (rotamase) - cyclophilin family|uniref:Peptidyl-prolyl cis-trans isomerase B (Cyclophilin B) n=2 Tax=Pseudonocardia thermophila TaxID=1848 RepID=A0A1M6Z5L1_PSETH|nr:peptidyl-prolyl cis-trans isomerase B (cyclophilin B) [Pseudonocardia thermophila]
MRREAAKRKLERQRQRRIERARRRKRIAAITSAAVVVVVVIAVVILTTLPSGQEDPGTTGDTTTAALGNCTFTPDGEAPAKPAPVPVSGQVATTGTQAVQMQTSAGPIGLTLDRSTGPCAVESFINLTQVGYFDDTPCHRLTTEGIKVLQCGDPTGQGTGGPGYTINDEPPTHLPPGPTAGTATYPRGTLAMAKTAAPNSGGSQFFLVYEDSPLPPDYTVFGTVDEAGLATLDKIAAAGDDGSNGPGDGRPTTQVTIEKVSLI